MEGHSENIDMTSCPFCSQGNENKARFCVHCGSPLPKRKRIRLKNRYALFGTIGLVLIAAIIFFWTGVFESRLVGRVNGEGISRKDFSKMVDRAKKFYELRYGQGLFEGQTGKENLNRLKTDILDELVVEKILLQEARRAGYTSVSEEEIERQVEAIKKQFRLSDTELKKRGEDIKAELRKERLISQFVEKAVLKGEQANAEQVFGQWITKAKANSKIETFEKLETVSTAKASCCKSGCGGGRAQPLDPKIEQKAKAKALEYYEKKTEKKGAIARVTNFGCHIQIDIIEDNKVVISLTYNGREIQEI